MKCTNLTTNDQFLCDIFTYKGTKVLGHHQSVPHADPEHTSTGENKLCCCCWFGAFFFYSFWGGLVLFYFYFGTLLDGYNSIEKIRLTKKQPN